MTNRERLIEQIAATKSALAGLEEELKREETSPLQWVPKPGDVGYYVSFTGNVERSLCDANYSMRVLEHNHLHRTESLAKAEAARRRASVRTYLPKKGDTYWTFHFGIVASVVWHGDSFDWARFYMGAVKETREEIEAWLKGDGKFWITAPQEECGE